MKKTLFTTKGTKIHEARCARGARRPGGRLAVVLALVGMAAVAGAQDAITVSDLGGQVTQCTYDWTSDGSGNATGRTSVALPGVLFAVFTEPSGTAVPTANYDVVVKQTFTSLSGTDVVLSTDLAGGNLADRSAASAELVPYWPDTVQPVVGKIQVEVSNAGAAKSGKTVVQIVRGLRMKTSDVQLPFTSGSAGQIAQYESAGRGKWVSVSGEATMADGGAVTLQGSPGFTAITTTGDAGIGGALDVGGGSGSTGMTIFDSGAFIADGTGQVAGQFDAGGGYGSTGVTISSTGAISANGNVTFDGRIAATGIDDNGGTGGASAGAIATGTYTPTLTGVANVTSTVSTACRWTRVGNEVWVRGRISVSPTSNSILTTVRVSLPISTDLDTYDLSGTGYVGLFSSTTYRESLEIVEDTSNEAATFKFASGGAGVLHTMGFLFNYEVK